MGVMTEKIEKYKIRLHTKLPQKVLGNSAKSFLSKCFLRYRSISGIIVYAIMKDDICVANALLKHNYLHRYGFMKKGDMIINPYWTNPDYQRRGYASHLLQGIKNDNKEFWKCVYAVVVKNNIASRRCLETNGFELAGYTSKRLWIYNLKKKETDMFVYVYRRG